MGALAITLMGHVSRPQVLLDLPAPHPAAATSARTVSPSPVATVRPVIIDKPVYAGSALVADPALIEASPLGPLPRIADDGRKPMDAYAAPPPGVAAGKYRIAILVSGLGISARATAAALAGLPPGVSLGFAPYANDVQHWLNEARQFGHEALLEVPMEPFDFPDSDPGPHTLRSGAGQGPNLQRLAWILSRVTGYAGVTNLLGQRFLSDSASLSPVLAALNRRGLYFYDNGDANRSAASRAARDTGTAFARAEVRLDAIPSAQEIDRQLSALEAAARAHGSAAGSGFLYPVTVDRLAVWAKTLAGRGFVLVPVSAIVSQPK
jgi:polysaccharide deacetylase 2 family uncharacterized protein YibQ